MASKESWLIAARWVSGFFCFISAGGFVWFYPEVNLVDSVLTMGALGLFAITPRRLIRGFWVVFALLFVAALWSVARQAVWDITLQDWVAMVIRSFEIAALLIILVVSKDRPSSEAI